MLFHTKRTMLILAVVIGLVPLNLLGQSVPLATDRGRIHVASIPDPLGGSNLKVLRTDTNSPLRAGTAWIWEKDRQEEPQTYYASMRAKGLNGVRMILFDAWEVEAYLPSPTFTPTDWKDPVYRARQLARMERSVNYASAHGLYVIINAHNKIPNYNVTYCDALWTYVAPYFANRTHVLYEAANEPMDGIGNNGSMTANATDNAANHPRIQALKATFNIIRNAAPLTHVMILTPSGINDYATGTGLGNLGASFASLPGAVDWTKTSVAYHLYNNDSAYGAATNAANLRNLHSRYPAWPSENAFPPGDFPNANGLDEWRSKPFPINGVNDLWVNQTCERLGLGRSMWFMNGQAQLDINWPIMIADANAKGWNWTADVLPTTSPVFTSAATAVITQNIAATIQLTATGGNITYAASILPAGLSLNTTTGLISGTTILAGMIPVSISATNSLGTTPATLTLDIRPTQDTTLYSEAFGAGNNAGWFSYSGGSSGLTNSLTNEATGTTDGRTLKLALIAPNSGGYAGTGIGITGTPPFTNSQKSRIFVRGRLKVTTPSATNLSVVLKTGSSQDLSLPLTPTNGAWVDFSAPLSTFTANNFNFTATSWEMLLVPNFGLWGTGTSTLRLDHIEVLRRDDISDPLLAWRKIHFGTTANSGNGADNFDYDHDGIANLVEYAFALNPTSSSAGLLPQPSLFGQEFRYHFTPPAGVSGVIYAAEWSENLSNWQPITNTGSAPLHIYSIPATGASPSFIRLRVIAP
jgi:aryl-phospho-beta-D-glucosidase BglC (GH1 family)